MNLQIFLVVCILFAVTQFIESNDSQINVLEEELIAIAKAQKKKIETATLEQDSSFRSISGETIQASESSNWYQGSRALASKIVEQQTINRKNVEHNSKLLSKYDLHSAFQLPLQRLSNAQLLILLNRYNARLSNSENNAQFEKMSKEEKLIQLQKLIKKHTESQNGKENLIRPTLFTNVNTLLNEETFYFNTPQSSLIANEEKLNIKPFSVQKNQIPELQEESIKLENKDDILLNAEKIENQFKNKDKTLDNDSDNVALRKLAELLNAIKKRYNVLKKLFKTKLTELNKKKMELMSQLSFNKEDSQFLPKKESNDNLVIFKYAQTDISTETSEAENYLTAKEKTSSSTETEKNKTTKAIVQQKTIYDQGLLNASVKDTASNLTYFSQLITFQPLFSQAHQTLKILSTTQASKIESITKVSTTKLSKDNKASLIDNYENNNENLETLHNNFKTPRDVVSTTKLNKETKESQLMKMLFGINQYVPKRKAIINTDALPKPLITSPTLKEENHGFVEDNTLLINEKKHLTPWAKPIPHILDGDTKTNGKNEDESDKILTFNMIKTLQEELRQNTERKMISNDSNNDENDLIESIKKEAACSAIACDFEKGNLCEWKASVDQIQPGDRQYKLKAKVFRRARRDNERPLVERTWHNWEKRYRNRLTGIASAQGFSLKNKRFAAAYVKPNQRATLTAHMLSKNQETIRFLAWEATRDLRLLVCCDLATPENDRVCVFETERGVQRGSRKWKEHTATCPKGTNKIIFECINDGIYQGACGVDNVHLFNDYCPKIIPLVALIENR